MTKETRSAIATGGLTLVASGNPSGWVLLAVAIADDYRSTA